LLSIIESAEKTCAKQRLRSLPYTDGHLGQSEPIVQPAAKDLLDFVAGFVLRKGEREVEGGDEGRLANK
jgi:hypothetical protein